MTERNAAKTERMAAIEEELRELDWRIDILAQDVTFNRHALDLSIERRQRLLNEQAHLRRG